MTEPIMRVYLGDSGLDKSWQDAFPATAMCDHCNGKARIAFVVHEGPAEAGVPKGKPCPKGSLVCHLHHNESLKSMGWPHDVVAVAVYLCGSCYGATALWNQG